ncbi:MAG: type I DNA topoisomerase [Rickettsiales bacterium]
MDLLIVESPSKAKTLNTYLGKDFRVLSSYGHVRSIPSEVGSVKPDQDFAVDYELLPRAKKNIDDIIRTVRGIKTLYLATDPDREGEAISWHLVEVLKQKKGLLDNVIVKRVVFNEITKKAVTDAIKNPRDLDVNLIQAQQARQALDYLVGFNLSPVLWRKLPGSRSAGRVQSVALRMLCERENEIESFKPEEYWSIKGIFDGDKKRKIPGMLIQFDGKKIDKMAIKNELQSSSIVEILQNAKYLVNKVEKKQQNRYPQPPFTTSTMLQEAGRKLGFSAKKTSKLAQDLYEGIEIAGETQGLITYMRTDSVVVSETALSGSRGFIEKEYGDKYLPKAARFYKTKSKNAQEAHEAIRPTNFTLPPLKVEKYLDKDHFRLYELIWKRMVASQMENAVFDVVSADIASTDHKHTFRANGSTMVFDGFLKLYMESVDDEEDEEKQILPEMKEGEPLDLDKLEPKQHFTQPPPRFTEASLVKRLEELGIGRPSTYPTIISILQEREYVKLDKKRFFPEAKGRIVSAFLSEFFTRYVAYDFTAKLEDELDEIAEGEMNWKKVLHTFWEPFKVLVDAVLEIKNTDIIKKIEDRLLQFILPESLKDKKCPTCKTGQLGLKAGKFGAFVGCSNYPECKYIYQLTSAASAMVEGEQDTGAVEFPKNLGTDEHGIEVTLRKGPYGVYVQLGVEGKVKRSSLPKGKSPLDVDLEFALGLLRLPRLVGLHPETKEEILAGVGRFGPFLKYQGNFVSLKAHDLMEVTVDEAVGVLAAAQEKKKFAPARTIPVKKKPEAKAKTKTKAKPRAKAKPKKKKK